MPLRLNSTQPDFAERFSQLLHAREAEGESVAGTVAEILARVRKEGDAALVALTERFDRLSLNAETLRFSEAEIDTIAAQCDAKVRDALELAAKRIRAYHEAQRPADHWTVDAQGTGLGWRWNAVDAVGLYVPGGKAAYPSSVLMNAIPAQVAGCRRIAMVVPTPDGHVNPAILAAAKLAGITEIYRIGGAQAVAALAYGTKCIAPVDLIVGPGNAYVAEAKRQVFGTVGIDMIAGPSEILVIADDSANPDWLAADLLSQAEHDADAQSILITPSAALADAVTQAVVNLLPQLPRHAIAEASWNDHAAIIVTSNIDEACTLANCLAPEHLELAVDEPQQLLPQIREAGAIFLGHHTPEAMGDYLAGPSHVLPTSRSARFSSGLSVFSFMKRTSLIHCSPQSFHALANAAATLADAEGLQAHAASIRVRQG